MRRRRASEGSATEPAEARGADLDETAFAARVRPHEERFFRFARRMLGDDADAEAAAGRALLEVFHAAGAGRDPTRPWLFRRLTNACVDACRGRRAEDFVEQLRAGASAAPDDRLDVERALHVLAPEARAILLLGHVEALSVAEIAEARGVAASAVKSHLARGERLVRAELGDEPGTDVLERLRAPAVPPAGFAERLRRELVRPRPPAPAFDLAASAEGITRVRPGAGRTEADGAAARALVERARRELAEHLGGERAFFAVPVDLRSADPLLRAVLAATSSIPWGETRSYRWVAEAIGKPLAVRAVGNALARNPVPFLVPCHRVLRSDGSLGGYGLGLDVKRRLLAIEREVPPLVGSATTRVVCRRGCPAERRIAERHRVVFASVAGAREMGYRPCRRCAPADGARR